MATYSAFGPAMKALQKRFDNTKKTLPIILANKIQKEFTGAFTNQGWDGNAWEKRKDDSKKPVLVKTGTLRRAVRNSRRYADWKRGILFGVNVPYAEYHNEGYTGMVYRKAFKRQATRTVFIRGSYSGLGDERRRGKKTKIMGERHNVSGSAGRMRLPQRRFMGHTARINKMILAAIHQETKKIF